MKLLEKGPLLKEERDRARKLTRGIQGFGSFCQRSSDSPAQGILRESSFETYGRSNSQSHFSNHENQENQFPSPTADDFTKKVEESRQSNENVVIIEAGKGAENSSSCGSFGDGEVAQKPETQTSFKENMIPNKEELDRWNCMGESHPLLGGKRDGTRVENSAEDEHPFNEINNQSAASLIAASNALI